MKDKGTVQRRVSGQVDAMHMALGDDERIDGLVAFLFTTDRRNRIRGQHEELTLSDNDNLIIGTNPSCFPCYQDIL